MPYYPFVCECGRYGEAFALMADAPPIGAKMPCECGKHLVRVPALPARPIIAKTSHHDFSDEEWAAKEELRECNEWLNAYGSADGEKLNVKGAQMTLDGIADKRKRIASGEKPPEELTWDKIMPHETHLYQTYDQYVSEVAAEATAKAS